MPLYEYRKNATNHISLSQKVQDALVTGTQSVVNEILVKTCDKKKSGKPARAAIEGWYGVDWSRLKKTLSDAAKSKGVSISIISTAGLFKSQEDIEKYRQPFVTDDPSFGRVNGQGVLEDILDAGKVAALKKRLEAASAQTNVDALLVIGPGAAVPPLATFWVTETPVGLLDAWVSWV